MDRAVRDGRAHRPDRLRWEPARLQIDERQREHVVVLRERAMGEDPPAEVGGVVDVAVLDDVVGMLKRCDVE